MPRYVDLEICGDDLKITLLPEGSEQLNDLAGDHPEWNDVDFFHDLVEWHLGNGWDNLSPEEIGALTACPFILCNDIERDEEGVPMRAGRVYWYPQYQVSSPVDELRAKGKVVLYGVDG